MVARVLVDVAVVVALMRLLVPAPVSARPRAAIVLVQLLGTRSVLLAGAPILAIGARRGPGGRRATRGGGRGEGQHFRPEDVRTGALEAGRRHLSVQVVGIQLLAGTSSPASCLPGIYPDLLGRQPARLSKKGDKVQACLPSAFCATLLLALVLVRFSAHPLVRFLVIGSHSFETIRTPATPILSF